MHQYHLSSRLRIALLAVIFLLGSAIIHPAFVVPAYSSPSTMRREQIQTIVLKARDAWVKGDAAAFANLFTAKGEFVVPGQRWQGRDVIRTESARFLENFTVSIQIRTVLVEGNQAAVEWDWQETPKQADQDGRKPTNQAQDAILIDFENGQIRRWREYIDSKTK
jgi:uncharacterized protein (TIGR02246 family)